MKRSIISALVFGIGLTLAAKAQSSPPPPPPRYVYDMAKKILPTQTSETFARYAATMHSDLIVTVNGQQVAASKDDWLAVERHRIGKVDRQLLSYVVGGDSSILVLDRFDDRSNAFPSADARYKTRAVRYEIGTDHLIHAIRILQADGLLQPFP